MVEVKETETNGQIDIQGKKENHKDSQNVCIEFEIYSLNIMYNTKYIATI